MERNPRVAIYLSDGREIRLVLDHDSAPATVENFVHLVENGYYNGLCFHRIVSGFMAQGGGYYLDGNRIQEAKAVPTIKGEFFSNEFHRNYIKHKPGVISMARNRSKNSASSQFFLCTADAPSLDGNYAAFGKVADEESLETVLDLGEAETVVVDAEFTDFPYPAVIIDKIVRLKKI